MQDFGMHTFDYEVGSPKQIASFQMSPQSAALTNVYKVRVTQSFKSVFGNFWVRQDVYVANENGNWRILWDYSK